MKYGTALIITAAALLGCSYVGSASARECLPGMDPVADHCDFNLDEQEPAPQPELQDVDETYRCIEWQKMAIKIAELRDQGAGEQAVVNVLAKEKQNGLIWIARQVYWPQSSDLSPKQIGHRVWMRCDNNDYPGAK